MSEAIKPVRRRRQRTESKASESKQALEQQAPETGSDEEAQDQVSGSGSQPDGGDTSLMSELRTAMREAAVEILKPVASQATKSAAKYAVTKGPEAVKDKVGPAVANAGGAGALAKGALSKGSEVGNVVGGIADKVTGVGKGGKKPTGHGRGRRLPVQEQVDVGSDIETVYDQFTQFEDWPNFMHRVEKVEQKDDTTLMIHENIWGVRRSWEAEIVEQTPCSRIVWRSKGPVQTVGVATFHRLSDDLTRVQINMDFQPKGMFEKFASGTRISRRALRSDVMRFKAFVEMNDEATGDWRGVIEDGEVSEPPEDHEKRQDDEPEGSVEDSDELEAASDDEEEEEDQPEASGEEDEEDEEDEDAEDEEPEASEDEDEDDYEEEDEPAASADDEAEEEEEEEPPAKAPARRRSRGATATPQRTRRR
jgi:uncharacterized membrane protein